MSVKPCPQPGIANPLRLPRCSLSLLPHVKQPQIAPKASQPTSNYIQSIIIGKLSIECRTKHSSTIFFPHQARPAPGPYPAQIVNIQHAGNLYTISFSRGPHIKLSNIRAHISTTRDNGSRSLVPRSSNSGAPAIASMPSAPGSALSSELLRQRRTSPKQQIREKAPFGP